MNSWCRGAGTMTHDYKRHCITLFAAVNILDGTVIGRKLQRPTALSQDAARPGFIGKPGSVRSSAWIWLCRPRRRPHGREDRRRGPRRLEFLGEIRVVRQLERTDTIWRELVGFEDALHRTQVHPACSHRQHPAGPVGCFSGRRPERQIDHALHGAGRQRLFVGLRASALRCPPP
jgi:hypothetical protein